MSVAAPNDGVQFSVRDLLIAVAGVACVLSAFSMYGAFGASLIVAVFGVLLVVSGRRAHKRWVTFAGFALVVPSLCALAVMLAGWLLFDIGPIYSQVAWPHELQRMAKIGNAGAANAKVAGLGSFLDSEHVWRLSLSADELNTVTAEFGLLPVSADSVPPSFWQAFPRSWRPAHEQESRYFSTPNFPAQSRGPDGDHYFTMYDPGSEWMYVWHKFNF